MLVPLAVVVLVSTGLLSATAARAQEPGPAVLEAWETGEVTLSEDGVWTTVESTGSSGSGPGPAAKNGAGGGTSAPPCVVVLDTQYQPPPDGYQPPPGQDGAWYVRICRPESADGALDLAATYSALEADVVWLPASAAPPVAATAVDLAAQAARFLPVPAPVVGINPSPLALVRVPTWLWVAHSSWERQTATTAVPGLAVTVVAQPTSTTWDLGEPGAAEVLCAGPGTAYDSRHHTQVSTCTHTFRRTSAQQPGGQFSGAATTSWRITWRASNGQAGELPPLRRRSDFSLTVADLHALVVETS